MMDAPAFDLRALPASFYDDPYPTYDALRAAAPVFRLPDGGVFVSAYAHARAIYEDTQTFSSDKKIEFGRKYGEGSRLFRHHTTSLVFSDDPYHARVRRLIMGALIPRALAPLEGKLEILVAGLIEDAAARGAIDAVSEFAAAIPVEVIGDLLAVPSADRAPLRGWSLAILGALEPQISDETFAAGEAALAAFHAYLDDLIADRKAHPGDPQSDTLTRLIQGDFTPEELKENCVFLLNAGHETTTNLIGNGLDLFARFPDQRARVLADPSLMRSAIEEILRYESSNQLGNRITTAPARIADVEIAPGTSVTLGIGAANRDPAAFSNPHVFDVARDPNPHLAFAAGPHQCAGMNLARLEGRIALSAFLRRFPNFAHAAAPKRARRARFRGFETLPLTLGGKAS